MKRFKTILIIGIAFVSWNQMTHAQSADPEISNRCSDAGDVACCEQYNGAIEAVESDWEASLNILTGQERPASEMVDDAYENLRTYNCWLEYICRSVQYSGYAPIESGVAGLTSVHLGEVPGCQDAEDITLGTDYASFVDKMQKVPLLATNNTRINYFPACQAGVSNNESAVNVVAVNTNFEACKATIERKFGCDPSADDFEACANGLNQSTAIAVMETALKTSHAEQKASALENKLASIVTKMHAMETHLTYVYNFLSQLDQRLYCVAKKCT